MATPNNKFHAAHYNALTKDIRAQMEVHGVPHLVNADYHVGARNALIELAVRFAIRFEKDNPRFDPHAFLDRCSPDAEQYPLSLLWDDRKELVK